MSNPAQDFKRALLVSRVAADHTGKLYVKYVQRGDSNREGPFEQAAAKKRLSELLGDDTVSFVAFEREPTKLRSAVRFDRATGLSEMNVGTLAEGDKVVIFFSRDYDNKGNLFGPFEDITDKHKDAYYLLAYEYSPDYYEKMGWDLKDREKLIAVAKKFRDSNRGRQASEMGAREAFERMLTNQKVAARFATEIVAEKKPTFQEAKSTLLAHLKGEGWKLSAENLKIPHATTPDGKVRIWFKPQALWFSVVDSGPHNMQNARSVHTDIRTETPEEVVKTVERYSKR